MTLFSILTAFDVKIDISIATNIIIAFATTIATAIHFDSQRKLRLYHVWDINKEVLLDLTHSLSEAIKATEIEIQNCYSYPDEHVRTNPTVWRNLDEKINYMLTVYRPLVSPILLSTINRHKEASKDVGRRVHEEYLDDSTAYETMLEVHKALYNQLQEFIAEISGVGTT
ncbi:hypothetical protein ACTSKR_00620 [Chitinibacteraceae bacterium HSL-7]